MGGGTKIAPSDNVIGSGTSKGMDNSAFQADSNLYPPAYVKHQENDPESANTSMTKM